MLASAILLTSAFTATAEEVDAPFTGSAEAGTGFVEFRLGYYNNADNGDGNPFLDEELTVVEPIALIDYNITDRVAAWFQFSYDSVSSASIDRLSKTDNQSGASGDYYYGFDFGARYEIDENRRAGGFVNFSNEYDYASVGFGGDFAQDFGNKDATVKLSANAFFDKVDVILFNGREPGVDDRTSISTTLSWYQIVNPRVHAELGATFGYQTGFLETAFNAVVVEDPGDDRNPSLDNRARGTEFTEKMPNTRLRGSLFGRTRYSVRPGTALELGGRLYNDSWGIFSFTLEPRIQQQVFDRVMLKAGYRYYNQTAADDFKSHFTSLPSKRTQDSDLGKFGSHGINAGVSWEPIRTLKLDFTAGYTFRDDGIDHLLLSVGFRKSFDARPIAEMLKRVWQ
ncbi:MAG: hypothetical protein ACI8W3_003550 [Myxococcota bacterium]